MTFADYITESKPTIEQFKKWVETTKFKNNRGTTFQLEIVKFELNKYNEDEYNFCVNVSKGTGSSPAYKGNLDWCDEWNFIKAAQDKFGIKFRQGDLNLVLRGKDSIHCMNMAGFGLYVKAESFKL